MSGEYQYFIRLSPSKRIFLVAIVVNLLTHDQGTVDSVFQIFLSCKTVSGRVPQSLFLSRYNSVNSAKFPISVGIDQTKLLLVSDSFST
jgi:hypothetical protein